MTSTVFYRKYRPQKFSDLLGQETIVQTLLGQLQTGKIGHGYLFYGPRGTGKTSTARIFAKSVNCQKSDGKKFGEPCNKCASCLAIAEGSSLDLIEIDAASNRGIDEIRDLREKVKLSPAFSRFKVYIIDEAHMLTSEAFNALLKTLEEPPRHAIFILCTTELGKLPSTIISRLQRFNFLRAGNGEISKILFLIAKNEGIKIEQESTVAIAAAADGSFRDAVSILDQLGASGKKIGSGDVAKVAKVSGWNQLFEFAAFLADRDIKKSILTIEEIADLGGDVPFFARQLVLFLEKLLFIKIGLSGDIFSDYDRTQIQKMAKLSEKFETGGLQDLMRALLVSENEMKLYPLAQIPLVLAVCKYFGDDVDAGDSEPEEKMSEPKPAADINRDPEPVEGVRPKKAPEAPKPRASQKGSIADVEKNWAEFLNRVKRVNAHVVALLRSTKPAGFDGRLLTLEVFYRFHKEKLEEPKILAMLDRNMQEVVGRPVSFKFVLAKRESKPTVAVIASDVVDIRENELEKIAQEIFSK
jgi:DNA polymerase-3 subunit gamma/tau